MVFVTMWLLFTTNKLDCKLRCPTLSSTDFGKNGEWQYNELSRRLDNALLAYHPTHKTLVRMYSYKLLYGKPCQLPIELIHKVMWAIKRLYFDWIIALEQMQNELNVLDDKSILNCSHLQREYEEVSRQNNWNVRICSWWFGTFIQLYVVLTSGLNHIVVDWYIPHNQCFLTLSGWTLQPGRNKIHIQKTKDKVISLGM